MGKKSFAEAKMKMNKEFMERRKREKKEDMQFPSENLRRHVVETRAKMEEKQ